MKDARGHGSNGNGGSSVVVRSGTKAHGVLPTRPFREGQGGGASGGAQTSNAQAAQALMSGLKSTQAPVHDAWSSTPGGDRDNLASLQASIARGHAMRSAGDGRHVSNFDKSDSSYVRNLSTAYKEAHGWDGDVGKHNGG